MPTLVMDLDPTGHYSKSRLNTPEKIFNALGLIPSFLADERYETLRERLEKNYQFGTWPITGGKVENSLFKYPEDPDQYPLCKVSLGDEVVYQYLHSIIAVVTPDETFVTRMD